VAFKKYKQPYSIKINTMLKENLIKSIRFKRKKTVAIFHERTGMVIPL